MKLCGFSLGGDFISIVYGSSRLDLHNDYAFAGLHHRPIESCVDLTWLRRVGEWVSPQLPSALTLHFSGVYLLKVLQRDPEMPHSEDACVSILGFMWNDLIDEMQGSAKVEPDAECNHFVAAFYGGSALKIGAQATRLALSAGA